MMKNLFVTVAFLIVFFFSFQTVYAQEENLLKEERLEATVVNVIENGKIIESDGFSHPYQKLELVGDTGSYKGKNFIVENGARSQTGVNVYEVGDRLVLTATPNFSGETVITITDYVRRPALYFLLAIFIALTVLIGGKRGFSAIVGMVLTFFMIFWYLLPSLSNGADPVLTTGIAAFLIIPVLFLLSHGFSKKTLCAIGGTYIALVISCILAYVFLNHAHLTGYSSEEAGFLEIIGKGELDIRGLLFAGIVISLLGVLDDISIAQASVVFKLKEANKKFGGLELFRKGMDVGRDHIASLANTLILVYTGASLPLLLLFINNPLPFSSVINTEILAEEIVKTLVASIGLVLAVPITTAIASIVVSLKKTTSTKA